jgi:mxaJ protein
LPRAARHARRCAIPGLLLGVSLAVSACGANAHSGVLRVCADPNNLPFSNDRGEGFENRLAEMIAAARGERLEYAWWPQRRGFIRNTLAAHACDVIVGLPTRDEAARVTQPYYRSTYVFVSRQGEHPRLTSLDDPRLRRLRIGVQMIGDDFANSPPAHALSARGLIGNIAGYSVFGDYSQPNPPARIVAAVASQDIDVALVWGPLAGYFARRAARPLEVSPLADAQDGPSRPFAFDISMAVRKDDVARQRALDAFIVRQRTQIDRLLTEYGVPRPPHPVRGTS